MKSINNIIRHVFVFTTSILLAGYAIRIIGEGHYIGGALCLILAFIIAWVVHVIFKKKKKE